MTLYCPLCNETQQAAPLRIFDARSCAQHFLLREEDAAKHIALTAKIEQLWGQSDCNLHECENCGLTFTWPFKAGDGTFYELAFPSSGYPADKWEFQRTRRILLQSQSPNGYSLEIGAGFGNFLSMLPTEIFPKSRMIAVEYNPEAIDQLEKKGIRTVRDGLYGPQLMDLAGKISNVFMFQVLEHLDDLSALANLLNRIASPDCNLFIAVPNQLLTRFNEQTNSLEDIPPNHISRWNERSLAKFANLAGFEQKQFGREPVSFLDFIKQDIYYSHLKRAQKRGTLANRTRSMKRSKYRSAAEAACAILSAPNRLPAWASALPKIKNLGGSIWGHYKHVV